MSITPLEFAAYGIEVILASGGDGARAAIYTDSLSSADVLCGESPSALLMRVIHFGIVGLSEFRALAPMLTTRHYFGEGNPCADLASRGRFAQSLRRALGALRGTRYHAAAHRPEPGRTRLRRLHVTALPLGARVWAHHRARPDTALAVRARRRPRAVRHPRRLVAVGVLSASPGPGRSQVAGGWARPRGRGGGRARHGPPRGAAIALAIRPSGAWRRGSEW